MDLQEYRTRRKRYLLRTSQYWEIEQVHRKESEVMVQFNVSPDDTRPIRSCPHLYLSHIMLTFHQDSPQLPDATPAFQEKGRKESGKTQSGLKTLGLFLTAWVTLVNVPLLVSYGEEGDLAALRGLLHSLLSAKPTASVWRRRKPRSRFASYL